MYKRILIALDLEGVNNVAGEPYMALSKQTEQWFVAREQAIVEVNAAAEALFDAGMAHALSQITDLLANDVDGLHLYTMNNPVVARRICEGIRNLI